MGQVTQVTSPSGSGNTMTITYDKLGQVITKQDFEGKNTAFGVDYMGRVTRVTDAVGSGVQYAYNDSGNLSTTTDGNGRATTLEYDGNYRLTRMCYPESKYTRYFYDSVGRPTKAGAGSDGTLEPKQYFFSGTTGLVTKILYTNTYYSNYVEYGYDALARPTRVNDWMGGQNNDYSQYFEYDDGGRLTRYRDFDDNPAGTRHYIQYTYDAAGGVITMRDYGGYNTVYTYTDTGRVSTVKAPDTSKVWDYDYNALGEVTQVSLPNGMTTQYGYDGRNRLTAIDHKDGATVLDGFEYALDKVGNITKTTHQDDAYWDYGYDGRYRLTSASRKNSGDTIQADYQYTYDAGDNLLTKAEPFSDDFNDGDYTGWGVSAGTWDASNHYLTCTTATGTLTKQNSDASCDLWFSYYDGDTSSASYNCEIYLRKSGSDYLHLTIYRDRMHLFEHLDGDCDEEDIDTVLDTNSNATTSQGTWYDVRVHYDGANITVWRAQRGSGNNMAQVLSTSSATLNSTTFFNIKTDGSWRFDDLRLVSGSMSTALLRTMQPTK